MMSSICFDIAAQQKLNRVKTTYFMMMTKIELVKFQKLCGLQASDGLMGVSGHVITSLQVSDGLMGVSWHVITRMTN